MTGLDRASTVRKDNRWRMMAVQGGQLSLKQTAETRSMKKALHFFLNCVTFLHNKTMKRQGFVSKTAISVQDKPKVHVVVEE